MNANEISALINTVKEGVEKSMLGNIFVCSEGKMTGINRLPYDTFICIISALVPKPISTTGNIEVTEPKEGWEGGDKE